MPLTVAIIGRPNVGKSTLFNRIVGKKLAIVHDSPGVTRDFKESPAELFGLKLNLIDTAGLEESFDDSIPGRMRKQTETALSRADIVLLVIDAREGITPMDEHFARWLRKQSMKSFLIANKCDTKIGEQNIFDAYSLGMGDPIPVSAEHGTGIDLIYDMLQPLVDAQAEEDAEEEEHEDIEQYEEGSGIGFGDTEDEIEDIDKPIKLAIVGRPNVGKSTLINTLLQEERVMTGPEAGITRDSITVNWAYKDREFRLVDTAGMRRKSRVYDKLERMTVEDSLRAIRLAQVVVLVLDADGILEKQDLKIAEHVLEEGRALVIAINKWDAVEDRTAALGQLSDKLQKSLSQARDIPTVTISALKNQNLDKLMDNVLKIYKLWNARVGTGLLNRWLTAMERSHPAPMAQGRPNRLRYMTQVKARPPTFSIWVSKPKDIADSYKRYLVNGLRDSFDLPGTPIRLHVRTSKNPYAD